MDDDGGSDDAEAKDVLAMGGASARAISLKKMVCWMSVVPRPPYCLGPGEAGPAAVEEFALPGAEEGEAFVHGFVAVLFLPAF